MMEKAKNGVSRAYKVVRIYAIWGRGLFRFQAKEKVEMLCKEGRGRRISRPKPSQPKAEQVHNDEDSKEEAGNLSLPESGSVSRIPRESGAKFVTNFKGL